MATKRKRRMHSLTIKEISGVDFPAQEGARFLISKRVEPDDDVEKFDLGFQNPKATNEVDGHQHLLDDNGQSGSTTWETSEGEERSHSHSWIRNSDGTIDVLLSEGHDHQIIEKRAFTAEQRKQLAKEGKALPDGSFPIVNKGDLRNAISAFGRAKNKGAVATHIKKRARALGATDLLPDEGALAVKSASGGRNNLDKELEMSKQIDSTGEGNAVTQEQLDAEKARADRAEKMAELTDEQKSFHKDLGESEQESFLQLDADGRQSEVDKSKADDPVVYKDLEGNEYRKSDDQRVVSAVKRADKAEKTATEERELRKDGELSKRAAKLTFVKGKDEIKVALLKAIDGIEDEDLRKGALEIIEAANSGMKQAFEKRGTAFGTDPEAGDAEAKLEKMAEEYKKTHSVTIEKARAEILMTEEGAELANEVSPAQPVID